ncbi:uncharacterized protein LOC110096680 [Dendrobium catenatum]|uniref:uncharacterized protein LOC110096680 n=1 Tax=Dendrobium catenatum TaxID=906689 RepID=UPI0010A06B4C|nr:uncharacterized protein LOC110096680 [Dendrobium catenatum]
MGMGKLTTLRYECFVCVFGSVEARDAVLCGGPWFIGGNIVGLDRWMPSFSTVSMEGLSSSVWIRLPNLPQQYWDECNISRIASKIGVTLWIDAQTGNWGIREYARVCIRMNLANKLQAGIWANGLNGRFYQKVEYKCIGLMSFGCGKVGHRRDMCPSRVGGQGDNGNKRTREQLKQTGSGAGSLNQQLGSLGKLDQTQTKKNVAVAIKIEGGRKVIPAGNNDKGKMVEVLQEVNGGNANSVENLQEIDDQLGPWIQVPPRRRRSTHLQVSNKENIESKQNLNLSKQVDLGNIQAPASKLKPTHKQSRMGFKQPLLFKARMRLVNRFQLGPSEEIPRKRKKEMVEDHDREDNSGGDASPFVF